jgi:hypothetical protein
MRNPATLSLILTLILTHLVATTVQAQQNQPRLRRFTFEQFSARHDANRDGNVERDESAWPK